MGTELTAVSAPSPSSQQRSSSLHPATAAAAAAADVPLSAAWTEPTRLKAAWHSFKVVCHILRRAVQNLACGPRRVKPSVALADAPVMAEHRTPLWADGRPEEFVLRCGKVHNLRMAVRCFDGLVLAPGQVLSFWSQVGWPSRWRGFVRGREIVNGCVVPTVGGGLCQLSNGLAAIAAATGARLIERHRHSALIEAQTSPAEDATVAWNYVDLRIVADFACRIEAELTADELVLRVRASQPIRAVSRNAVVPVVDAERRVARGCLTCEQTGCFRHRPPPHPLAGRTAVLLGDRHPELARWLEERAAAADWMLPWVRPGLRQRAWSAPSTAGVHVARWPSWQRMLRQRLVRGEGGGRQALRATSAAGLAAAYARQLTPLHTELLVMQELVVPLWRLGALDGRTFDVYVPELPASELQARLDAAAALRPEAASLRDFRVDAAWQADEWKALRRARRCLTAHQEVQRVLAASGVQVTLLDWTREPSPPLPLRPRADPVPTLVFPASALPRKGAIEVAAAARALGARVLILGSPPADPLAWQGVAWTATDHHSDWLAHTDVVVLPAFVEHQPHALLRALDAGVPVVASPACGLGLRPGLTTVPAGDVDALMHAIAGATATATATAIAPPIASPGSPGKARPLDVEDFRAFAVRSTWPV
jgi:hypothetical protein